MSGSTSFGNQGRAAVDPAAVAKISPDSSADEVKVPTEKEKKKMKKKGQEEGKGKDDAKTEAGATGGSQTKSSNSSKTKY